MSHFPMKGYVDLLAKWVAFSQKHLYYCPEREGLICYGAGEHGHWGVHTHQKAFSGFAVAAMCDDIDWAQYGLTRETVLSQALGMLRYNLSTHLTGDFVCTDGEKWGNNWIYVLGVERMFHAVEAIWEHLTDKDQAMLRAMMINECDFLLEEYPIKAGLVKDNKPESNIWNGATLYRGAFMYPDAPNRERYIEKAQRFFANGISIESDENSDEIVDGRRVGDMFVGANMFDSFACNHHGYMNVGYMVISLSNIAMLHFSLKARGLKADDIVYHNMKGQWELIRTCTFDDGRLLRIGGDSRARYCYCQDYAIPMWAMIEDLYGEDCSMLEQGWLKILEKETETNGDGSFLSNRFGAFEELSPVYYTRLETDRANVISMAIYWHKKYGLGGDKPTQTLASWHDDYHGASMVADDRRYASFVWRSSEKPQGMLLPMDDSSLAEWRYNLAGRIQGVGRKNFDEVDGHSEWMFEGGFLTSGSTIVYSDDFMAEGQLKETMARKSVAFAALPDGASVLALQHADALNRTFVSSVRGVYWNVANDIFNKRVRTVVHENGRDILQGGDYAKRFEIIDAGRWVNVDGKIGLASLAPLSIVRMGERQVEIKGRENSATLYAEEICAPFSMRRRWYDRGENLLKAGFAMTLGGPEDVKAMADTLFEPELPGLRAVGVTGRDGKKYVLAANFGKDDCALCECSLNMGEMTDLRTGAAAGEIALKPGEAVLLAAK
ncbi:MAG: hypothetical protein IJE08_03115 [Clostridia bacterium]|nr:hypothetical protein [Clostridia bacterium]